MELDKLLFKLNYSLAITLRKKQIELLFNFI